MKNNIAAVVVLYNPDKNFINNIYTYINQVSLLIVVDNSENPDHSFYNVLQKEQHVKFIINNENTGIAKAVNTGVQFASAQGFEWVLLMDQDSFFEEKMIQMYLARFNELTDKKTIAVIGPEIGKKEENIPPGKINSVNSLITSGSIINVEIFMRTGGYNEKLFIDEVDHEYCYRIRLQGYSVLQMTNIYMEHSLGRQSQITTILQKKKIKSFHSPVRLYYIVRNCCYIISIYKKKFPEEIKLKRKDMLVRIKNNFLYGNNRLSTLKHVILGFVHYKMNRFGKLK